MRARSQNEREDLFKIVAGLLKCTRIAISEEKVKQTGGSCFHVLCELRPGVLWKNVDAEIHSKVLSEYNLIPLQSFGKGLRYILAAEQDPLFWNYDRDKAEKMLELQKNRKRYSYLDAPNTTALTPGVESSTEAKEDIGA